MSTYMQGQIQSGATPSPDKTGTGVAIMSQSVELNYTPQAAAGSDNVDAYFDVPKNTQITDVIVDPITAWDSATSAGLTVGSAAGGAQYSASANMKTLAARNAVAPTAAICAALASVGSNTRVYIRVAQVGNTSAGKARVTLKYIPGTN